jgi:Ca-activated chloride channel family protein
MRELSSAEHGGAGSHPSSGGRLVARDGREAILREAKLQVDAGGGIARTLLVQRFVNPYAEPLNLTYQLALPADGAVAEFSFRIGERFVIGEIDRRESARERFEQAILEGRTAALVEQDRSSVFTQEIGNVPPQSEVVATTTVDQRLAWLAEGAWEWRFPTVVAPRYLGRAGRVPDASRISVDVVEGAPPARLSLELTVSDALAGEPSSPAHTLRRVPDGGSAARLVGGEVALDRDIVVRWPVATASAATRLEVSRAGGERLAGRCFGLLTLVPPRPDPSRARIARDLIVMIDASGSMRGHPFEQARRIAHALVRSLDESDTLELIAFANAPLRFHASAARASGALRSAAHEWLDGLEAGGATEMAQAIEAALVPLREGSQRQVVLITDGLIGFESEIVAKLLGRLPASARLHTVGVGPAPNRSLTAGAARAGRGVEVLVAPGEDGTLAAERLLAHVGAPLVTQLEVSGSALRGSAPIRLRDLAAGAPVLVSLELDPAGGDLALLGEGLARRHAVPAVEPGGNPALARLFARERVEDLELRAAAGESVNAEIESLGLSFQIATRCTSWVAIDQQPSVDPRSPVRRVRIPQALPEGTSIEGLGLRLGPRQLSILAMRLSAPTTLSEPIELSGKIRRGGAIRGLLRGLERRKPRRIRGRLVLASDAELGIELAVEGEPLDWYPAPQAELLRNEPADGKPAGIIAAIDPERSTRPGRIEAGFIVRIVVRLEAPLLWPISWVALGRGAKRLVIELRD